MANAVYPEYKEFVLDGASLVSLSVDDATNGPFCALVDTGTYTYNAAHNFYDDLSGVVGTDQRISTPTVANGTFDGDNLTYTAVSGATVEALVVYRHNAGANSTWKLVLYLDASVTGLPVTPNGGNIVVTWHASGIFTISDRRLKENIVKLDAELLGELPLYSYNYIGSKVPQIGVMAQEVHRLVPRAIAKNKRGHMAVDYGQAVKLLAA